MKIFTKISFISSIVHFGIVGIFFIEMFTLGQIPGEAHPLIIPFFFYMIVSFLIPPQIIIFCILGILKEDKKIINMTCLILSFLYELGFTIIVIKMWPSWMSV